jgi:hypothetical protein
MPKGNIGVTFDCLRIHFGCDLLVPMKLTYYSTHLAAVLFWAASTLFLTPASYAGVRHINLNRLEHGEDRGANRRHEKESKEGNKDSNKQDSKDSNKQDSSNQDSKDTKDPSSPDKTDS